MCITDSHFYIVEKWERVGRRMRWGGSLGEAKFPLGGSFKVKRSFPGNGGLTNKNIRIQRVL